MGKYEPLKRYLENLNGDSWEADFEKVEHVLGFKLPDSAYQYQAWWANQTGGGHSQTHGWQDAGFETRDLNISRKRVRFERVRKSRSTALQAAHSSREVATDIWNQAELISGIRDRDRLVEAALAALIEREAARSLARMGGTMPDAKAAPRERPFT